MKKTGVAHLVSQWVGFNGDMNGKKHSKCWGKAPALYATHMLFLTKNKKGFLMEKPLDLFIAHLAEEGETPGQQVLRVADSRTRVLVGLLRLPI